MAKEKTYEDPTMTRRYLMFKNGMLAKINHYYEKDNEAIFCVIPTKDCIRFHNLDKEDLERDPRYNRNEDWYEIAIDKDYVLPLNWHPLFNRYLVFTDWEAKRFEDPWKSQIAMLIADKKRLTAERDAMFKKVRSLTRTMNKLLSHDGMSQKKTMDMMSEIVNKMNPLMKAAEGKKNED